MKKIIILLLFLPALLQAQNVADLIRTSPIPATGANKNNRATVDANLKAMYALLLPRVTSNTINGAKDSSGYIFYNVITDRVVSARSMNVFDVLARVSDLTAYVPYNGATSGVNLKPYGMEASSYRAQQTNGIGVSYRLKTTNGLGDDWAIIGSQLGSPDGKQFRIAVADPTGGLGDLTVFSIDYDVTNPLPKFKFILEGITPLSTANNKQIPTTEWVKTAIAASSAGVSSFNGRTGAVTPLTGDYAAFYSDLTSSQSIGGVKTYTTGLRSSTTPSVATDVVRLSDLGNYVTTNTDQTITGAKTFTAPQNFTGGYYTSGYVLFNAGQSFDLDRNVGIGLGSAIRFANTTLSNTIPTDYSTFQYALGGGLTLNTLGNFNTTFKNNNIYDNANVAYVKTTALSAYELLANKKTTLTNSATDYPSTSAVTTALSGYASLSGSYANPSWITSLAYSKLTGAPTNVSAFTNDAGYVTSIGVAQGVTTTGGVNPTIGLLDITPRSVTMTNATAALGGLSASSLYIQRNIADRSNAIRSYTGTTVDWIYGDDAVTGDWYIERYSGGSAVDRPFRLNKATGIPAFLYSPTMPTATTGDNTTKGASTAFVQQELTASGRTRAFLNSNITLALNGDYLSTTSTLYTGVLPPTTGFLTDGSKLIVVAATGTAGARISCPTGYTLVGLSGAATPGTGGVNIVNGGKVQLAPVGTNAYQYYALSGTVIVN